jgi:hypothetical protein
VGEAAKTLIARDGNTRCSNDGRHGVGMLLLFCDKWAMMMMMMNTYFPSCRVRKGSHGWVDSEEAHTHTLLTEAVRRSAVSLSLKEHCLSGAPAVGGGYEYSSIIGKAI